MQTQAGGEGVLFTHKLAQEATQLAFAEGQEEQKKEKDHWQQDQQDKEKEQKEEEEEEESATFFDGKTNSPS